MGGIIVSLAIVATAVYLVMGQAGPEIELLGAMLRPEQPKLGIEGFGPERAMYEAVLAAAGMHREDRGVWRLARPSKDSGYQHAWDHIVSRFHSATTGRVSVTDIFATLGRPP